MPGVGAIGADGRASKAVALGENAAAMEEVVAAAVLVVVGSGGFGGGDDMVETKLADTKVIGARVLPGLGRRL